MHPRQVLDGLGNPPCGITTLSPRLKVWLTMSVYFLDTGRILGFIMVQWRSGPGKSVAGKSGSGMAVSVIRALSASVMMLLFTTSPSNAAVDAPAAQSEQTMNRPAVKKSCRLKSQCKTAEVKSGGPLLPVMSPEQIVNRIDQALTTADAVPVPAEKPIELNAGVTASSIEPLEASDDSFVAASAAPKVRAPAPQIEIGAPAAKPVVIKAEPATESSDTVGQSSVPALAADPYGAGTPFSISVDGETLVSSTEVDKERKTDVGLAEADIQVKYDGLDTSPLLYAAHSMDGQESAARLRGYLNYPDYVTKAEFRIYRVKDGAIGDLVDTLPAGESLEAVWQPENSGQDYAYVLRVYDEKGRFDETKLIALDQASAVKGSAISTETDLSAARNIPVHGGSVTVYGRNVPAGYHVKVMGEEVATDGQNSFVTQKILPPGDHDIDVAVYGIKDDGLSFTRQVNIPDNDWFYVGLADLTVGHKFKGLIENASDGSFKRTYTKGRLAFYLKGKIKGKYLLTAAADTQENDLKNLFTGWDKKDPRHILRGLDPDDYYPVYGDDSSLVEDAPTKGKFYVRLERGKSHVMWGNFKTRITGTKFAAAERALYGAGARFQSESATSFGEAKTEINLYAAEPGTASQRDNFQGTGGSAYFLKRQLITTGSEQVSIEIRDPLTGRVTSTRRLTAGQDYEIDYIQGVILLKSPLASSAGAVSAVSSGALSDSAQHLVVNYEYSPAIGKDGGQIYGARMAQWLGDRIQVGVTGSKDSTGSADNQLIEADARLRLSEKSHIEFEVAQSRGRGIGQSLSTDGGLTFKEELPAGSSGKTARAYRAAASIDLGEISDERFNGKAEAYYEQREAGFTALDAESTLAKRIYGGSFTLDLSESLSLHAAIDAVEEGGNAVTPARNMYEAVVEANADITENIALLAGVRWSDYRDPATAGRNGSRADVGARLTYLVSEKAKVFAFGQTTAHLKGDRLRNDRIGVGAELALTDNLSITGDISTGTTGLGGSANVAYESSPGSKTYLGYKLDPDRDEIFSGGTRINGRDGGVIVAGTHRKLSEWLSAFSESNADFYGRKRSLTQVYGVSFTPDDIWSASLGMELGTILDPDNGDFDRRGFSAKLGYMTETVSASANFEARFEDSRTGSDRDRNTYLARAQASWKTNENWRLSAHVDALFSQSGQDTLLDGDYVEASIGYAYRPVLNDRLNVLFKYAFLYDLPGPQQVNTAGDTLGPLQRSHVLSADASYDVNEYVTVGAKYGYRFGEIAARGAGGAFTQSSAHLGIIRVDVNVVKNWDAILEGRVLYAGETNQVQYGALAAVYRHFGNNAKIGIGYNFGKFSDDLTDLTHDDSGVFLNVIGKF